MQLEVRQLQPVSNSQTPLFTAVLFKIEDPVDVPQQGPGISLPEKLSTEKAIALNLDSCYNED